MNRLLLCTLLGASACKPVDEAPPDLDALLHTAWQLYPDGEDTELAAAMADVVRLANLDELQDQAVDGRQSPLGAEELDLVDLFAPPDDDGSWSRPDPALAAPIFLFNLFDCTRQQLEPVLYALDQNAQYEAYDSYSRTYTSELTDFAQGSSSFISWEAESQASNLATGSYSQLLLGGLRRVPPPALEDDDPVGSLITDDAVLARTWIPFPAHTDRDAIRFEQDYQIEAYIPVTEGRMLHLYGVWRQLDLGGLGTLEGDGVARIVLNNLVDWDDTTEALCAAVDGP